MKIAIIDDDFHFSYQLKKDLLNHFHHIDEEIDIDIFSKPNLSYHYLFYFLDIDLVHHNGIDIARQIKLFDKNSYIIFISAKSDLVYTSLTTRPFFFIRKMNYQTDIHICFNLMDDELEEEIFIPISYHTSKTKISINEIMYIETQGHKLLITTKNYVYNDNRTLKEFLDLLPSKNFIQIQRSYIININYLKKFQKNTVTMTNEHMITIGRTYNNPFRAFYQEYLSR